MRCWINGEGEIPFVLGPLNYREIRVLLSVNSEHASVAFSLFSITAHFLNHFRKLNMMLLS